MLMRGDHASTKTSLLHHTVEGPVAVDRTSSFPTSCCCWRGPCHVGLWRRGGRLRGLGPGAARHRPHGAARRSYAALPPFLVPLRLVGGGGGWCWCGAASHAARSVATCNRGPTSLASASTSGLSRPHITVTITLRLRATPDHRRWCHRSKACDRFQNIAITSVIPDITNMVKPPAIYRLSPIYHFWHFWCDFLQFLCVFFIFFWVHFFFAFSMC
jgi:hypothetical protein